MDRHKFSMLDRGITLVEMLVAVAIIGILLAVAVPSLSGLLERRRVVAAAGEIAGLFTFAKSQANMVTGIVDMHLEPVTDSALQFSCARISLRGGGGRDNCSCNQAVASACATGSSKLLKEFILPRDTSVTFQATPDVIWEQYDGILSFERMRYNTTKNLKIEVKGRSTGARLWVEYNNAGRTIICSPDAPVGGYKPCS